MVLKFVVTACLFNDARAPGPKQWTVILRPIDAAIQVNADVTFYSASPWPVGTEFVLTPVLTGASA